MGPIVLFDKSFIEMLNLDEAAIVRHYTFSPNDLFRRRRGEANRLRFAVHLAYFRYPGRIIGVAEAPP